MRPGRKKAQHLNRVEGHVRRTRSFQDEARTADGYNELHGDRIVDLCYDSSLTDDRYVSHGAAFTQVHCRGPSLFFVCAMPFSLSFPNSISMLAPNSKPRLSIRMNLAMNK